MRDQPNLPRSARALMAYVDDAGWTEHAELVVHIMMSSVHPDVEASIATAAFLPRNVRLNISHYLSEILLDGFSAEQQHAIHTWAQCWAVASLDQHASG